MREPRLVPGLAIHLDALDEVAGVTEVGRSDTKSLVAAYAHGDIVKPG